MALTVTSFDSLCERLTVVEKLLKHFKENGTGTESNRDPAMKLAETVCPRKSLEKSKEGFDASDGRKKRKITSEANLERPKSLNDVEARKEILDEHFVTVTEHVESSGVAQSIDPRACITLGEIESREQSLRRAHELLAERERKVDEIIRALDERSTAVEVKEKEINCFLEEKRREIELKEEDLRLKLEDEKLRKQQRLKDVGETVERLKSAENRLDGLRENLDKRLEEIEIKENVAWESAALKVMEAELIRESTEKQLEEFEKRIREFSSFQVEKMRELESKEQLLNEINEKAVKDVELRNDELIREQLEELEKKKSEFKSFEKKKMGELYSKERLLTEMSKKIAKDAKLRNETLVAHERSINQLLKRLKLDRDNVESLKEAVDRRCKSLVLKENEVNSTSDWVERRMDEADSKAKMLKVKRNSIKLMEDNVKRKKYELRNKEKELDSKERALQAWQEELEVKQREVDSAQELNEQRMKKLDARENSMRELTSKCFKEHQAKKKELLIVKDSVEKVARFLGIDASRELKLREKRMTDHVEHSADNSNSHVRKELDESPDLKFTVRMDGKTLQMFLNDPQKDLVAMGDEIFKVLHLSSDPAKLVLDAMVGYYPPHLREQDTLCDVRWTCISLLKQLMKMSTEIKPCVREEALQLALAWKSKMRGTAENPSPLEALGFLLLLAAYDVASSFDKDEISTLMMMVSPHREERHDLHSVLGLAETLTEKWMSEASGGGGVDKASQRSNHVSPLRAFVSP